MTSLLFNRIEQCCAAHIVHSCQQYWTLVFLQSEHNKSYKVIGQIWRINLLYSPTGEYNNIEIFKMAASHFVKVSDKEISEIKMNSDQKNTKKLVQKY